MTKLLNYTELSKIIDYYDRLDYLLQHGRAFEETFGSLRHVNQQFYRSRSWRQVRNFVIVRDNGFDLGVDGVEILGSVYVHHMNPITPMTLVRNSELVLDPEYLITVSFSTHQRIHYCRRDLLQIELTERRPRDTDLW